MGSKFNFKKYLCLFAISITISLILLWICKIVPFGENTLVLWDAETQYINFYMHLRNKLIYDNNIFYSFSSVLGNNFYTLSAYYLMSPFYILFILFKAIDIVLAIHLITILKIAFCSLSFLYMLSIFKIKNHIVEFVLAISYSLIGFNTSYFIALSWLDGVILLPLIFLGLYELVTKQKSVKYIMFLSISIITNYYIGWMLCISSILIYILIVVNEGNSILVKFKETIMRFLLSSLLSGLISSFIWIPVICNISNLNRIVPIESGNVFNFKFHDLFSKLFTASTDAGQLIDGLPMIFIGIFPLLLISLFFLNKKITAKIKISYFLLISFLCLSFLFKPINILWHGCTENVCFNYRYSFIFSFFLLVISAISLKNITTCTLKDFVKSLIALIVIAIFVIFQKYTFLNTKTLILDIIFIISFVMILYYFYNLKHYKKMQLLCLFLVISNLLVNSIITYKRINSHFEGMKNSVFKEYYENMNNLYETMPNDSFYRVENANPRTINDSMLFDLPGVTGYSSTENLNMLLFSKSIGMRQTWMESRYVINSPFISNSLLGIRYIVSDSYISDNFPYLRNNINGKKVYENKFSIPLFFTSNSLKNDINSLDFLEKQEHIWNSISKTQVTKEELFTRINYEILDENDEFIKIRLNLEKNMPIYFENLKEINGITMSLNGEKFIFKNLDEFSLLCLGEFKQNDEVILEMNLTSKVNSAKELSFFQENMQFIAKLCSNINSRDISFNISNNNKIEIRLNNDEKFDYVSSTLPYDSGWEIKVDGIKTDTLKNWDGFLAFKITDEAHIITMEYYPEGLKFGVAISVISLLLGIFNFLRIKSNI